LGVIASVTVTQENIILTGENDRFIFTGQDYSIHSGYGKIEGKGGGDIIVFAGAKDVGGVGLTLDGGTGNDWLYVASGENAVTVGGLGRDWIFNNSKGGEIWGDVENSRERADGTRFGSVDGQIVEIVDNRANSDKFRWTAGVTIKDAQKSAANDNDAWPKRPFRFAQGEAA
jgi:hypothetical protein